MLAQRLVGLMAYWKESTSTSVADRQNQIFEEPVTDIVCSTRDQALPTHSHLYWTKRTKCVLHAKIVDRAPCGGSWPGRIICNWHQQYHGSSSFYIEVALFKRNGGWSRFFFCPKSVKIEIRKIYRKMPFPTLQKFKALGAITLGTLVSENCPFR